MIRAAALRNRFRVAFCMLAGFGAAGAPAATIYVNAALTTGADDGSSWENAFRTADGPARALAVAAAGDEIWVAAGTYKPTLTATRTISFSLRSGVGVYGGFAGGETQRAQRDPGGHGTVLSGDLAGDDPAVVTDNSFHVVNGGSADATAVLDGFTIVGGNASGAAASDRDRGGGMIFLASSNATIRNCRITGNRVVFGGGGTYIRSSSPTFVDCSWSANQGASFGGAIDMFTNCNPSFTRCAFIGNSAVRAGGVEVFGTCQPTFVNCIFRGNAAGASGGGALFVASSSLATLRHCTIAGNSSTATGSAILANGSTVRLFNSIVHENTGPGGSTSGQLAGSTNTVTYSCVEGGFAGTGNIAADPLFVDRPAGDLRLAAGSPCIDAAASADAGAGNLLDFAGQPRFVDDPATPDTGAGTPPLPDMGALEFQPGQACPADLDGDGAIGLGDLAILLTDFGCAPGAGACPGDVDGDGDTDLGDLAGMLAIFGSACP